MYRRVFIGSALISLFTSAKAVLGGNLSAFNVSAPALPTLITPPAVSPLLAVDTAILSKAMDAYYNGSQRYLTLTGLSGNILSPDDFQRFVLNPTESPNTTTPIGDN